MQPSSESLEMQSRGIHQYGWCVVDAMLGLVFSRSLVAVAGETADDKTGRQASLIPMSHVASEHDIPHFVDWGDSCCEVDSHRAGLVGQGSRSGY
jgi:hypothetical protein